MACYETPSCVSVTYDVEEWPRDMQPVRMALEELVGRAATELDDRCAQRLTLSLEMKSSEVLRRVRVLREPTGARRHLQGLAARLLEEATRSEGFTEAGGLVAITVLRVELGSLRRPAVRQGTLFTAARRLRKTISFANRALTSR